MGRKKKDTSPEVCKLIVKFQEEGKFYREIGALVDLSKSTVGDILKRFSRDNTFVRRPQSGRPTVLNDRDKRLILRQVRSDPKISAPKLLML